MWRLSYVCVVAMLFSSSDNTSADAFVTRSLGPAPRPPATLSAKKRKRKAPASFQEGWVSQPNTKPPNPAISERRDNVADAELTEDAIELMKDIASFEFKPDDSITIGLGEPVNDNGGEFKLPDIKDALRKKEMEQEIARIAEEELASKPKIKRGDTKAMKKLLESNPFADADDSFFEEQEYNLVSALLGERAKPFLGIPTGPIQVGHFIGSLGIMLMAFVEYPGFPLTNLPTPVRECFQGGLATVYLINGVLAVLSVFKAIDRGQPVPLWVTKTFAVGGLAFDQLTQLPTLDDMKTAEAMKGKRALSKSRRYSK